MARFPAPEKKGSHKRGGRVYLEVNIDEQSPNGHHVPVYHVAETMASDSATLPTVLEGSTCVLCIIGEGEGGFLPAPPPSGEIAIAYCTFLRAFDRRTRKYADEIPMPVLAGILRAGRSLSSFKREWPATLNTLTADPIPHAAVALARARTCGLRGVEKRASYYGCRRSGKPSSQLPRRM